MWYVADIAFVSRGDDTRTASDYLSSLAEQYNGELSSGGTSDGSAWKTFVEEGKYDWPSVDVRDMQFWFDDASDRNAFLKEVRDLGLPLRYARGYTGRSEGEEEDRKIDSKYLRGLRKERGKDKKRLEELLGDFRRKSDSERKKWG